MQSNNVNKVLIGVVAALIIIIGYQNLKLPINPSLNSSSAIEGLDDAAAVDKIDGQLGAVGETLNNVSAESSVGVSSTETTTIYLPLYKWGNTANESNGEIVGCGSKLEFVPKEVPYTKSVMTAVYKSLFAMDPKVNLGGRDYENEIGNQTDYIRFVKANISGETAIVYLEGTPVSNECADPRLEKQIERAATQFPNIKYVNTILNGKPFDWSKFGEQKNP